MRLKANLAADAALVVTTLIWGSTFVIAKDILDYWPPIAYLSFRLTLAALVLAAVFPKHLFGAGRGEWAAGAVLGLLIGCGFAGQAVGQVYTTPSKSAFVTGLTTPLVPFVAFALLRVRPSVENMIGVTLASVGGALILAPGGRGGVNVGDLITLGCTALFATHITLVSVYARRYETRRLTVLQIAAAACVVLGAWLAARLCVEVFGAEALPPVVAREAAPLVWSARVVWQLVYLAIVATVIT
ncbi:MAG: DMT family transporter, partial [Pyrinomonadaceae bacterium]